MRYAVNYINDVIGFERMRLRMVNFQHNKFTANLNLSLSGLCGFHDFISSKYISRYTVYNITKCYNLLMKCIISI